MGQRKRQGVRVGEVREERARGKLVITAQPREGLKTRSCRVQEMCVCAVSYTHLDVYKRQNYYWWFQKSEYILLFLN